MTTFQDLVIAAGYNNISILSYGSTDTHLTMYMEDRNNPVDNISEAINVTMTAKNVAFILKKKGLPGGLGWFNNQTLEVKSETLKVILDAIVTDVHSELAA